MQLANEKKTAAERPSSLPDPYFILPKVLYFLLNWLTYSTHSYIGQFMGSNWGVDKDIVNAGYGFQITNFFGAMVWGGLADRTRKFKLIATGCVIMSTAFTVAQAFPLFSGNWRNAYYFFLNAGAFFFSAGTFPIIDSIVLSALQQDPTAGKDAYGKQKMWGTIAHNVCTKVVHSVYDFFDEDYNVMFYSMSTTMVIMSMTLLYGVPDTLRVQTHKHHGPAKGGKDAKGAAAEEEEEVAEGNSVVGLFKRPAFVFFLLTVLAAGIVRAVNTNNHSLFITDYLHMDKKDVGDLMLARLPMELGLLFFAKRFMAIIGPYWFMILGQLAGLIRIALYLFLRRDHGNEYPEYAILILIEMLKGANSSMVTASAVRIASDLAPAAWAGTAQTLVSGVWQGVSMSLGALIAFIVLRFTGQNIYYVFFTATFIGLAAFSGIVFYYTVVDPVLIRRRS